MEGLNTDELNAFMLEGGAQHTWNLCNSLDRRSTGLSTSIA